MPQKYVRRTGRLRGLPYVGIQRYFLTLCTAERRPVFMDAGVVDQVLAQLLRSAGDHGFALIAYCLMPDHAHLLTEGTTPESDLPRFVAAFKQKSGFEFAKARRVHLWQKGYYDRVLRDEESTLVVIRYILDNPVRAGLVERFSDYPFSGSDRYSVEELAIGTAHD